tara:strand:- start:4204 stop:4809 length:606 start_codon:yes stop_codon:yes gene_type:complete
MDRNVYILSTKDCALFNYGNDISPNNKPMEAIMPDKPKITFNPNEPVIVTLKFDKGFENEGKNGPYFSHTVENAGVDTLMFASPTLNDLITCDHSRGDTIRIIKHDTKPVTWGVHKEGDANVRTVSNLKPVEVMTDARTHDIHRQVAVKIVCQGADFTQNVIELDQYYILEKNVQIILDLIENKKDEAPKESAEKDEDLPF